MTEPARTRHSAALAGPVSGFSRRLFDGAELVAHNDVIDALSIAITRFGTLYEWARSATQPFVLRGRAPVYVARVPGSDATDMVVRHAWHGGLFAPLTRDLFTRPTRAPIELCVSHALKAHNIRTPELMAYALYAASPGVVRFDVASRYIPDSYDFAVVLAGTSPIIARQEAFAAIELLLRSLAEHGFTHPDLNVKNVLLSEVNGQAVAWVLDVDVVQQDVQRLVIRAMEANVSRLVRSMVKSRRQFGVRISDREIREFRVRMLSTVQP